MQFKMRTQRASGTDHQGCQILSTLKKRSETEQTNKTPQTTQTKKSTKTTPPPSPKKPQTTTIHQTRKSISS